MSESTGNQAYVWGYPVDIEWSELDGEFVVTCPAFPHMSALGKTKDDAFREAATALELMIEACRANKIPLPQCA